MTLIPPSGAPQAGGSTTPQAGEGGTQQPQDGQPDSQQQPSGQEPTGQQPQSTTTGSDLTPELRAQLDSWLKANTESLPQPIQDMLRDYRQENRSLRDRLKQQGQQGQQSQEGQPQLADLQRTVQQQQERLRQGEIRYAVAVESQKLGIIDPEAAYRLLETDDIDWDDRDRPQNVGRLLAELARERPWLKASAQRGGSADGGAGSRPAPAARSMNDALREATGRVRR